MSGIFNFDSCVDNRKFNNVLTSRDPQKMYLSGVKYDNNGERGRAKRIYLEIMERFEDQAIALKAADRLASMNEVIAVERSNSAIRRAVEQSEAETQRSIRQANRDAEARGDQDKREFCRGKNDCLNSCSYGGSYSNSCASSCRSKYSMCN
ncbi:MAG: hypothetical protein Q8Q28_04725 [Pseudomonadota bacterium]|nr:hypothetical protein [Pseudomonadota bacterium]